MLPLLEMMASVVFVCDKPNSINFVISFVTVSYSICYRMSSLFLATTSGTVQSVATALAICKWK